MTTHDPLALSAAPTGIEHPDVASSLRSGFRHIDPGPTPRQGERLPECMMAFGAPDGRSVLSVKAEAGARQMEGSTRRHVFVAGGVRP